MNIPGGDHEMIDVPGGQQYEIMKGKVVNVNVPGEPEPQRLVKVMDNTSNRAVWLDTDEIQAAGASAFGLDDAGLNNWLQKISLRGRS